MINSYISGILYEEPGVEARKVSLDVECHEDFMRLVNPTPYMVLCPKDGWRPSNEPEDHLDAIANQIAESYPKTILCTSYKDISLAKRIQTLLGNRIAISILFDARNGLILKPAEECIIQPYNLDCNNLKERYDLILCRHFLEHSSEPTLLLSYLSRLLSLQGSIYIEVPSIERFLQRNVPLFVWEQHAYYFSARSLIRIAANFFKGIGFIKIEGADIEPSICIFLTNNGGNHSSHACLDVPGFARSTFSLSSMIQEYKCKWIQASTSWLAPIALLGIGHAADRFRQWTGLEDKLDYMIDADMSKLGLYLANSTHPISAQDTIKSVNTVILGVHDRDTGRIRTNLQSNGFAGKILSIYDCPMA